MYVGKLPLLLCFTCIRGQIASTSPPQSSQGDLTERFLRYDFLGAYIWRGLYMERLIFGILRLLIKNLWFIIPVKL